MLTKNDFRKAGDFTQELAKMQMLCVAVSTDCRGTACYARDFEQAPLGTARRAPTIICKNSLSYQATILSFSENLTQPKLP